MHKSAQHRDPKMHDVRICNTVATNHYRKETSKMRNARDNRTVCTDRPRIKDPKMHNVRICRTVGTNRCRDENSKMRDVRIHRTVCTDRPSIKDPKMYNVRICKTVDTNRCRDEDEMKTPRCGMSESLILYAQIGPPSKSRKCQVSESTERLTQIDAIN